MKQKRAVLLTDKPYIIGQGSLSKKRLKRIKYTPFVLKRISGGVIVNYKYADSGLLLF